MYLIVLEGNEIRRIEGSIYRTYRITDQRHALDQVQLLAPVIPNKMIAIGLNYTKHAEEVNKPLPDEPMMFLVSPTAVAGPGDDIYLKNPQNRTEHEGELAIVMGKRADHVSPEDALDYVLGYTCCNDISDRVLQKVSQVMSLEPGDVIITGTPSGVAPLQEGDTVEVRIDGIGSLINTVS